MRLQDHFTYYEPGPSKRARAETTPGPGDSGLVTGGGVPLAPVVNSTPMITITPGAVRTVTVGPYSFELQDQPTITFRV